MSVHTNNGACPKCQEIFAKYPGVNADLKKWFEGQQKLVPNFHIAEAGRGRVRQELMVSKGLSRAGWGKSAHNYNCAIDTFFLEDGEYSLAPALYALVTGKLPAFITWYGAPHAEFYERPHFQVANWRTLAVKGLVKLVEPTPAAAIKRAA